MTCLKPGLKGTQINTMSMLKIANMRVPYPEMANYGTRGLPDNIAYIDREEFDDLSVCEELESDVGYASARETPRRSPKKVGITFSCSYLMTFLMHLCCLFRYCNIHAELFYVRI